MLILAAISAVDFYSRVHVTFSSTGKREMEMQISVEAKTQ